MGKSSLSTRRLKSFREVIELWKPGKDAPLQAAFRAMASAIGGEAPTVDKWWQRDTLPSDWWLSIVRTEVAKTHGVTSDLLAELAARRVGACA